MAERNCIYNNKEVQLVSFPHHPPPTPPAVAIILVIFPLVFPVPVRTWYNINIIYCTIESNTTGIRKTVYRNREESRLPVRVTLLVPISIVSTDII